MTEKELHKNIIGLLERYQKDNNVTVNYINIDWFSSLSVASEINKVTTNSTFSKR